MAQRAIDSESVGGDSYKGTCAIVLVGGNDGNNLVIPNHSDATVSNYAAYSAATPRASPYRRLNCYRSRFLDQ
ncbi:MAG: hypothetical protein IPI76_13210 [Chloracidobacterium sp.]|nr:hypothetical protein [Chloracidobacterium sp.]